MGNPLSCPIRCSVMVCAICGCSSFKPSRKNYQRPQCFHQRQLNSVLSVFGDWQSPLGKIWSGTALLRASIQRFQFALYRSIYPVKSIYFDQIAKVSKILIQFKRIDSSASIIFQIQSMAAASFSVALLALLMVQMAQGQYAYGYYAPTPLDFGSQLEGLNLGLDTLKQQIRNAIQLRAQQDIMNSGLQCDTVLQRQPPVSFSAQYPSSTYSPIYQTYPSAYYSPIFSDRAQLPQLPPQQPSIPIPTFLSFPNQLQPMAAKIPSFYPAPSPFITTYIAPNTNMIDSSNTVQGESHYIEGRNNNVSGQYDSVVGNQNRIEGDRGYVKGDGNEIRDHVYKEHELI